MFKKLADFFKSGGDSGSGDKPATPSPTKLEVDKAGKATDQDLHIATAVLLIEMASSDQDIAREEAETVCSLMQAHFGIADEKIPELVGVAIAARRSKGKINEFVATINERFTDQQRQTVLAMIWKIVMADGKVERYEHNLANQLQNRLRLSEDLAKEAKKMVEEGKV